MVSHRISAFAFWVALVFVMGSVGGPTPAVATHGTPFFDDFSDGNVSDDMPVSWSAAYGAVLSPSSGDLILQSTFIGRRAQATGDINVVGALRYADISVRTQIRLLEGTSLGGFDRRVGLYVGRGAANGYAAGIHPNGEISITRGDGVFIDLATTMTVLDVFSSDIHLRFDLLGDTLSLWAWADGTLEPALPQLTVTDLIPVTGIASDEANVSLVGQLPIIGNFSRSVFRFAEVRIIPEPSTALLMALGLAALSTRSRTGLTDTQPRMAPHHRRHRVS